MKKNIFLFLLLVGLLTFTYYYQEIGSEKKRAAMRASKTLFQDQSWGEIEKINLPFAKIIKRGNGYYTSKKNFIVDPEKLEQILDVFSYIQSVSILDVDNAKVDRSHFFPNKRYKFSFEFENGSISYHLGKKLEYSQDFYLEINVGGEKRVVVARDTSAAMGIYDPKKMFRDPSKYKRLKNVIFLGEDAFYNLRPLKGYAGEATKIKVENVRNKRFSVDLKKIGTIPPAIGELIYDEKAVGDFWYWLKRFESLKIHPKWDLKSLDGELSKIEIISKEGPPVYLKLFSKWENKKGYFLTVTGEKGLFQVSPSHVKKFYSNVQDFWLKKALKVKKGDGLSLKFEDGKEVSFKIVRGNPFKVMGSMDGKAVRSDSIFKLVSLLVKPAQRVSELSDMPNTLNKSLFKITTGDFEIRVYQEKDELLLVHDRDQTVFHYKVGENLPIGLQVSDYISN